MKDFKKTISGIDFNFMAVKERNDQIFRVTADSQTFKMITDEEGTWGIWQQVPRWIKDMEEELANAIEEQEQQL
ncbi:MAG TPA: hypothetical protein VFS22_03395 [Flavisolibacter sp.]|nr:hypothetical protein [Flavisolibacter sp.]